MEISLAIIGSAGRKDDAKKMSKKHFEAACVVASSLIDQINESNYPLTHLVSGGAAFIDHVAVRLFLDNKVPRLRLFLPAQWEGNQYHDTGEKDPKTNPGGTCNYYHRLFSKATFINSLYEIQVAKDMGAELIPVAKGFYARNALVAKSDFILACTFGKGREVKEGGTADTIRKYLDRIHKEGIWDKSFHYDLSSGEIYEGCTVPPLKEVKKTPKAVGIRP